MHLPVVIYQLKKSMDLCGYFNLKIVKFYIVEDVK